MDDRAGEFVTVAIPEGYAVHAAHIPGTGKQFAIARFTYPVQPPSLKRKVLDVPLEPMAAHHLALQLIGAAQWCDLAMLRDRLREIYARAENAATMIDSGSAAAADLSPIVAAIKELAEAPVTMPGTATEGPPLGENEPASPDEDQAV
jgi:hypothetical protein